MKPLKSSSGALVPAGSESMPPALAGLVRRMIEPTDGLVLAPPRIPQEAREPARRKIADYERRCAPVTRAVVDAWISEMMAARLAQSPQGNEALDAFVNSVMFLCSDVPVEAWSAETLRKGLRTWRFWPSAGEVDAVVRPEGERLLRTLQALRDIAASSPEPGPQEVPQAERITPDAAAAILRKWGYRSMQDAPAAPAPSAAAQAPSRPPRTPEQQARDRARLIAAYEAQARQGGPMAGAAQIRLAALRAEEAAAIRAGGAAGQAERPLGPTT